VYSCGLDNNVYAVNASNGNELWSHSLHGNDDSTDETYTVHASNGVVYSGGRDKTVIAAELNGATFSSVKDGTNRPQLYYDGKWLRALNDGTTNATGDSY
jgi:hypothetical protein